MCVSVKSITLDGLLLAVPSNLMSDTSLSASLCDDPRLKVADIYSYHGDAEGTTQMRASKPEGGQTHPSPYLC